MKKNSAALFFLFLGLLVVLRDIFYGEYYSFLWYCDIMPFLFAIGFFFGKEDLIKSAINIGLIPQFAFSIDFLAYIVSGKSLWGFFSPLLIYPAPYIGVSVIIHLFSSIVAFALTYRIKIRKETLFYSFIIMAVMDFLVLGIVHVPNNINYIQSPGGIIPFVIPFYSVLQPILAFIVVILPTYFLQKAIAKYFSKKRPR